MSRARLILEHAPTPQATTEIAYHGGQLVVGRGDDVDWQVTDPDKYVSRKHFVLSADGDDILVTDASTGGLFVDGASTELGVGNSVRLEDGMRLRFGDFVAKVELAATADPEKPRPAGRDGAPFSFEFEPVSETPAKAERPADLPEPFGVRGPEFFEDDDRDEPKPVQPIDRDDPFALDLKPAGPEQRTPPEEPTHRGGYFDTQPKGDAPRSQPPADRQPERREPETPEPAALRTPSAPGPTTDDAALRAAFFRGLGLDPGQFPADDPAAEMEALGRRFRALTDGLLNLLRIRAEEKQKARVAQTIVGSANVNPLKFAVGVDDAIAALVAERGTGYLDPDAAVSDAFRDLIDHHMRNWTALQAALRQMIDKFDPEEIEREVAKTGLLEALIAGGRSAKLWQLYEERYREIARAAEERFLGEIGADFRDAYENKGRKSP